MYFFESNGLSAERSSCWLELVLLRFLLSTLVVDDDVDVVGADAVADVEDVDVRADPALGLLLL